MTNKLHLVPCTARGIGATDVAKVLGVSVYGKARDVFARMMDGTELKRNKAMDRGNREEPKIRERYVLETGAKMLWSDYSKPHIFRHPSERYWYCTCSPDDITAEGFVVDYKSASIWNKKWKNGPPIDYVLQLQWAMFVTGATKSALYAAFGQDSKDYSEFSLSHTELFEFERDDQLIADAANACELFWKNHVETRIEP